MSNDSEKLYRLFSVLRIVRYPPIPLIQLIFKNIKMNLFSITTEEISFIIAYSQQKDHFSLSLTLKSVDISDFMK